MTEAMIDWTKIRGLDEELRVDSSERDSKYLLISEHGGHVCVSPSMRQLFRWVRSGRSFEELASKLFEQTGSRVSAEYLKMAHDQMAHNLLEADRQAQTGPARSFWFRLRLIPASWVANVARPLAVLFDPRVLTVALAGIGLAAILLAPYGFRLRSSAGDFWMGYLLFLASLMVHEFGHASACARYGARPSEIGFTMYLIYPAFYSNVTRAWSLKRWQRVMVDLGGNYFQYLVGSLYIACFLMSGQEMFRVAFVMIVYGSAFSLNPVFKFDGYWMMADALGVTNLSDQPKRLMRHAWRKLRRQSTETLPWPTWVVVSLAVYAPLSFAFWGYFLWRLLPVVWTTALSYPHTLSVVGRDILNDGNWASLQQLLIPTFLLLIASVMLSRLGGPLVRSSAVRLRSAWTRGRQVREAT
jgi:putative peptide zinc metalloprotease protein